MFIGIRSLILAVTGIALTAGVVQASTHEDYKGKVVRIIVGYGTGGGFDIYARLIARHMGRHIPGNPTIIVENMPGAAGLIGSNHVYKVAKADGLTMANFSGGLLMGQILGRPGIEFDAQKFEFVGIPLKDTQLCLLAKASGITTVGKWLTSKTPVKLGGLGPGCQVDDIPKVLKATLGLPIRLVTGYESVADIRLAAEVVEVGGVCGTSWEAAKTVWQRGLDEA